MQGQFRMPGDEGEQVVQPRHGQHRDTKDGRGLLRRRALAFGTALLPVQGDQDARFRQPHQARTERHALPRRSGWTPRHQAYAAETYAACLRARSLGARTLVASARVP